MSFFLQKGGGFVVWAAEGWGRLGLGTHRHSHLESMED